MPATAFNWLTLTASVSASPFATPVTFAPPTEIVPGFVPSGALIVNVVPPLEIVNGLVPLPAMELMFVKDSANLTFNASPSAITPMLLLVNVPCAPPRICNCSPNFLVIPFCSAVVPSAAL